MPSTKYMGWLYIIFQFRTNIKINKDTFEKSVYSV